jgi:hypothetical protein
MAADEAAFFGAESFSPYPMLLPVLLLVSAAACTRCSNISSKSSTSSISVFSRLISPTNDASASVLDRDVQLRYKLVQCSIRGVVAFVVNGSECRLP